MPATWKRWTKPEIEFIRANAGRMLTADIAEHLGRTTKALASCALRWGISLAHISVDKHDAYLCRELYKAGLTVETIAIKMELSRRTVTRIIFSEGVI